MDCTIDVAFGSWKTTLIHSKFSIPEWQYQLSMKSNTCWATVLYSSSAFFLEIDIIHALRYSLYATGKTLALVKHLFEHLSISLSSIAKCFTFIIHHILNTWQNFQHKFLRLFSVAEIVEETIYTDPCPDCLPVLRIHF